MTDQPWQPRVASEIINEMAKDPICDLSYTEHAKERIAERSLIISDILYVLKHGFVLDNPEPSTVEKLYKFESNVNPRILVLDS